MSGYDVVIIGGGPAGLSAALTLSRARRTVLVVDAGQPRNARAAHAHNYLGREGVAPLELLALGRAEVAGYGGTVRTGTVTSVDRVDARTLRVALADESTVDTRRVLVATGLVDELPAIPGLADRWGRDLLHCPYCHGWEVRDQAVGIIGTGPASIHQTTLWRQWTDRVTLFANDTVDPTPEDRAGFTARGITVVAGKVTGIEVADDALRGIRVGEHTVPVDAAVVMPVSVAESGLLAKLGLHAEQRLMGDQLIGTALPTVDPFGATSVPGVWVAGNAGDLRAQVSSAAAHGVQVGAMINADLVEEDIRDAVALHPFTPEMEQEVSNRVQGNRRHGLN